MRIVIYVLIGLVALLTIFIGYTVIKDAIKEKKEEKSSQGLQQPAPIQPIQEAPKAEPVLSEPMKVEETAAAEPEKKEEPKKSDPEPAFQNPEEQKEGGVTFDVKSETLEEKYLALSDEYRAYYDEIVKIAMSVENSKRIKTANYEDYKLGKNRLVRLKVRRGQVIAELVIPNLSFKTYQTGGASMKQAPTVIRVVDDRSLGAVREGIAYTLKAIEEEKAYKKERAKERRRKAREASQEGK